MDDIQISGADTISHLTSFKPQTIHCITADHDLDDVILKEAYRVMKHGGYFIVMADTRRMYEIASLITKHKFKPVDTIAWLQSNKPDYSFAVSYLVDRMTYLSDAERETMKASIGNMKIPRLKKSFIPIMIFQKPPIKNQSLSQYENGVGLINQQKTASGRVVGNAIQTELNTLSTYFMLPRIKQFDDHLFSRAWAHILAQFTNPETTVLDLTRDHLTAVPCIHLGRNYTTAGFKNRCAIIKKCQDFIDIKGVVKEKYGLSFD